MIGQQKKNDTTYFFYDEKMKLIPQDGTKVKVPKYKGKYFYNDTLKTFQEIRCRLEEKDFKEQLNLFI